MNGWMRAPVMSDLFLVPDGPREQVAKNPLSGILESAFNALRLRGFEVHQLYVRVECPLLERERNAGPAECYFPAMEGSS